MIIEKNSKQYVIFIQMNSCMHFCGDIKKFSYQIYHMADSFLSALFLLQNNDCCLRFNKYLKHFMTGNIVYN